MVSQNVEDRTGKREEVEFKLDTICIIMHTNMNKLTKREIEEHKFECQMFSDWNVYSEN